MEFLASRKVKWAEGRIAVPAVFTFTTLTILATLLHLDRFHFNNTGLFAQAAAWFWLSIYAIVPPVMLVMWIRQRSISGEDPKRSALLPAFLRLALAAQAAVMLAWGFALFADPVLFADFWPWKLTPLTSRAIGAWLIGIGVFAAHSVIENDYTKIRGGLISYVAFGLFELITLMRYPTSFNWMSPSAWLYLTLVCSILLVGLYSTKRVAE